MMQQAHQSWSCYALLWVHLSTTETFISNKVEMLFAHFPVLVVVFPSVAGRDSFFLITFLRLPSLPMVRVRSPLVRCLRDVEPELGNRSVMYQRPHEKALRFHRASSLCLPYGSAAPGVFVCRDVPGGIKFNQLFPDECTKIRQSPIPRFFDEVIRAVNDCSF